MEDKLKILYVGLFDKNSPGEFEIAQCLKELGHEVTMIEEGAVTVESLNRKIQRNKYDFLLFAKFRVQNAGSNKEEFFKKCPIPACCWIFDLYWGL